MKSGFSYHCAYIRTNKKNITLSFGYSDENAHAEINAIKNVKKKYSNKQLKELCKKYNGLVLEVVRFDNRKPGFRPSFPCKECQKRINICFGIKEVHYS